MENKKIILPSKRFINSEDENLSVNINLEEDKNLLREGDKTIILDTDAVFNTERQSCKNYKIYGKLKMIFRNMYSGVTNYSYLSNRLSLTTDGNTNDWAGYLPYNEFAFLRNDIVREVNIPQSGATLTGFTPNITTVGPTGHTIVTETTAPYQNWNLYLSYVYDKDETAPMKYTLSGNTIYSFVSGDGIPFRVTDNGNYYTLISPVEHGMNQGEYITISGTTDVNNRTFYIESLGNEVYRSERYVLNILKAEIPSGTTLNGVIIGKRCIDINDIDNTTSQYYIHKHKTLTEYNQCQIYKLGFESPIWEDETKILYKTSEGDNNVVVTRNRMESVLFDFVEPFVLSGITNNLGYTPTEVYITTIFRNGNGYFNYPPKVGYKFNFHNEWIDQHFSGTTSNESVLSGTTFVGAETGYTFISGSTIPIGTILKGDFIEYIPSEMRERVISDTFHKITIPTENFDHNQDSDIDNFSGATPGNLMGIFYQAHHRVKLRELSPYTEVSTTNNVIGIPENSKYFENEKLWKWRDLYDHGYIDDEGYGVNFPYTNNIHYVKRDINFYLRNEAEYQNKTDGITPFTDSENQIC